MSKLSFKENRVFPARLLSKTSNIEQSPGVFAIQHEYATYKDDERFPYHYHDWYELYYMHHGSGIFRLGNREYAMNDGVWLFTPPGMKHKFVYTSDSHERTLIYFSHEYLSSAIIPHLTKLHKPIYITDSDDISKLSALMEKLQTEFDNPDEFSSKLYKNLLFEILVYLARTSSSSSADGEEQDLLITHVTNHIKLHFSEQIRLEDLAELNDISVSHLSKKFKNVTGMNFSYYLNSLRIGHAKKILTETTLSVSEISEKCGFNDSNYFACAFKKSEGISPIRFRKSTHI